MGWANQHLWEFRIGRQVYGQPMLGEAWGGPAIANAGKVRLAELLPVTSPASELPRRKTVAASRASMRPSKPWPDPNHPEHEDVVDWLDGYDPNHLNALALKLAVGGIASRRRAAKARAT